MNRAPWWGLASVLWTSWGAWTRIRLLTKKGLQSNLDKKKVLAAYLGGPS
jgi:hypothetical protein